MFFGVIGFFHILLLSFLYKFLSAISFSVFFQHLKFWRLTLSLLNPTFHHPKLGISPGHQSPWAEIEPIFVSKAPIILDVVKPIRFLILYRIVGILVNS